MMWKCIHSQFLLLLSSFIQLSKETGILLKLLYVTLVLTLGSLKITRTKRKRCSFRWDEYETTLEWRIWQLENMNLSIWEQSCHKKWNYLKLKQILWSHFAMLTVSTYKLCLSWNLKHKVSVYPNTSSKYFEIQIFTFWLIFHLQSGHQGWFCNSQN